MHTTKQLKMFDRFGASSVHRVTVAAFAFGACLSSVAAYAQETSAEIYGHAPAGEVVSAKGSTGSHRHVTVDDTGRYKLHSLSPGTYTVTLAKGDQTVDTRSNIELVIGRNAEIDFACPNDHCEASK